MHLLTRLIVVCLLLFATRGSAAESLPEARVTLRVVDEKGMPVEGATPYVTFKVPNTSGEIIFLEKKGRTTADGRFEASARALPLISYGATKDGYYATANPKFDLKPKEMNGVTNVDQYEPTPVLEVVLRRIVAPVPMYARHAVITVPAIPETVGFDLIAFDWIPPYGKGVEEDMTIALHRNDGAGGGFGAQLDITFLHDGDGIQGIYAPPLSGSALRLPHRAPVTAYESEWIRNTKAIRPAVGRKDQNYFFRIRTSKVDGKIVKAMYGKIYGEIEWDLSDSPTGILRFTYYLNPDGSENVEFDPKKNLFDLDQNERVTEP